MESTVDWNLRRYKSCAVQVELNESPCFTSAVLEARVAALSSVIIITQRTFTTALKVTSDS